MPGCESYADMSISYLLDSVCCKISCSLSIEGFVVTFLTLDFDLEYDFLPYGLL